jgi:hypothetical protein
VQYVDRQREGRVKRKVRKNPNAKSNWNRELDAVEDHVP